MSSSLSSRLQSIFSEREEGFIKSLQSILSAISSDQYIQQMFDDKLSANYIPDRVCEVIRIFLTNEQELFIEKLLKRIKALETCFGKSRILKLEEIGNKMMQVSLNQAQKEAEYRKIIQLLTDNNKSKEETLDTDSYNETSDNDDIGLRHLKEVVTSLSNSNNDIYKTIKNFESSLQKDFKKIRSQSRKFINRLNFSTEDISKLKSDNSKLLQKIDQLNKQNKALANKENQYQTELDKLKRKCQNLVQKQEDALNANKDFEEKMKGKYENKIKQIQKEMNNLNEQMNDKISQLQEKNKQLKQELEKAKNQNNTFDNDINSLQQKVSQLQNSNRLLKMDADSKQEKIDKYKNGKAKETQEFQKYLAKLTDQNKQKDNELTRKDDELTRKDNELTRKDDELTKKENELNKKDKQLKQIQLEKDQLQNELSQTQEKLSDYEKQLKYKQKELNANLADKAKMSENTNDMKNSFSEMIQNKDQEIARKQEKIESTRKEKQQLLSQNSELQKLISQIQDKLERKEQEIEQQQNAIKSLQNENEKLMARHSKLKNGVQDQVGKRDSEIQLLQNKIQSLKNRNSQLENSLHDVDQNSIMNQSQLETKQKEIGELKTQFQRFQSTIKRLQDQIKKRDEEILEKQQAIDSFETENNEQTDLNTQLQNTILQTKDKLRQKEKEIMSLKRKIEEYQHENLKEKVEQIPNILNEKEEAVKRGDDLEKQNIELKRKISELQLAVREAKQQLNHIKSIAQTGPNKEELTRQIQNYMNENSDLKIQNAHLQNQIQSCKEEIESLKDNFERTSTQYKEKERSIKQMKDKYNSTQQKMSESQMKLDEITEKCSEYESSLKMLAKKYQQKEKQINMHKKDRNNLRRKLQSTEEENQKLNISLTNVNDQLHNLKEEVQQKDDTINRLRESSENQISIQRELANVQRSLNEKSSLLNDSENRNTSLMREIEEKEARICQLSDSILNKDRELKTIQQAQMTAKRQNETLTALTQEQQRKLEEAHKENLSLHEELVKVQNEALTQSESIKAISIDQSREAEGRKQIQQLINQDREKYRNRISKLQEENTSLSVSKVDLQHKLDQLSFENKTLSQLLEAKENELSFEKERGSEDMKNATNVANKIIEENKQLKQQLNDKNQYDKELLNQIRDYYSTIQDLDEIPELIQNMVQTNEEQKLICDALKISDPSEIQSEITKLIKNNEELSNRDEQIYALFPDNNRNELPQIIANLKRELAELQSLKNKLQQITNSNNIQKSVQSSISSLKLFQKRELELTKIIPDYSFDRLVSDVSQLIHGNQENSQIIQQVCSTLGVSMPNNLPDLVFGINKKLDNYQNTENQIKQIVLINTIQDIIPHLQKFVKQNEQLLAEHKKICHIIPNYSDGDDLPQRLSSIIQENLANKGILKSLINSLPENSNINKSRLINSLDNNKFSSKLPRKSQRNLFDSDSDVENNIDNDNELVEIVSRIAHENEELKMKQKELIETHLNSALKKNKELMKEKSQIAAALNSPDSDNLSQKVADVVKENESIVNKLRKVESILPHSSKGNDLSTQIENALNTLNDLQNERNDIKQILSKDEDFNKNQKNDEIIPSLQDILGKKAELAEQLDEINSILTPAKESRKSKNNRKDRDEIPTKARELLKTKEELEQTLKSIISTVPDSQDDIQRTIQNLIQKNAEQETVLDRLNQMFPGNDDDLIKKISKSMNDKNEAEDLLNEIDSLLPSVSNHESMLNPKSKSRTPYSNPKGKPQQENVIPRLKNQLIRNEEMNEILKHLIEILPKCSSIEEVIPRIESLLDTEAAIDSLLDSSMNRKVKFNSPSNSLKPPEIDEKEIIEKLREFLEQKAQQEKIIEAIEFLLPSKSSNNNNRKSNDQRDILDRITEEIEKKKELEEQLLVLQSNMSKISGNECQSFDDVLNSIAEIQNQTEEMKNAIDLIEDVLGKQKSANNISSENNSIKKRTPTSKKQKSKRNQNGSSIDLQPLVSQIKNNSDALDQINDLIDQSDEPDLIERVKKELEKSNENQQILSSIQSMIPDVNSISDLQEKLTDILNEKESHKDLIQQASSILPPVDQKNKSKSKNNRVKGEIETDLINQAENAVKEIESLRGLINEIESTLPPSQTKNDILTRLKDEMGDKEKVQKQLEKLNSMFSNSEDSEDLPQLLQTTIKENAELKVCLREAHQILNSNKDDDDNQVKSNQKRKKTNNYNNNNDDDDEIQPKQLLSELSEFIKNNEGLKKQISELDSLLLQYENQQQQNENNRTKSKSFSKMNSKSPSKQDESLFDRIKYQLDDNQQNKENLDRITKQLFGESSFYQPINSSNNSYKSNTKDDDENSRNIGDIQQHIDSLQRERENLLQLFSLELEKENSNQNQNQSRRPSKSKQKGSKKPSPNDNNDLLDMANSIIAAKNNTDETLSQIESLLPEKQSPNETLMMRLKRELAEKEELQQHMNSLQSMFPDSSSPKELNSLISSLQEANNLSKDEQAELSSILQEEGEEGLADTVQRILKEKKQLESIMNEIESLLPPEQSINTKSKPCSKSSQKNNKDNNNNVVDRLKNKLNNEKEMKIILEKLRRIVPNCSTNEELVPQTENLMKALLTLSSILESNGNLKSVQKPNHFGIEIEEEEEENDDYDNYNKVKGIDGEKIIQGVQNIIDSNKDKNNLLDNIESLFPSTSDDNRSNSKSGKKDKSRPKKELPLLERIKNELGKKKEMEEKQKALQKQLSQITGNKCQSFDDIANSISELQNNNLGMKNTIDSIGTIFSTKVTDSDKNKPKKKKPLQNKENDSDQEDLVEKVDNYVDASENQRKMISEIESLLPPSKGKDDILSRIKKELNKKNEVTGTLQNMIPGIKTPEELSNKVKEILQENETLKKDHDVLNQILHNNEQDDDDNDNNRKNSLVDRLLPPQQIDKIKKRENVNIGTDDNENKITSKVRLVVDQNAIYQEFADNVVSLLPPSEKSNQKKSKKSQKPTKGTKDNENILNDDEDVLTKLKNELKIKEKIAKQLDKMCSLLSLPSNDSISSLFDDSMSSKLQEILKKIESIDSIIPNNLELSKSKKSDMEEDEEDDKQKDNLIPRCRSLVQAKEKQDSILAEMDSLLQKSASSSSSILNKNKPKGKSKNKGNKKQDNSNDDSIDIVQKLKNELNDKSQLIQLLDSLKSFSSDGNDDDHFIDRFKTTFNSNNELNQLLNEICNLLNIGNESNNNEDDDDDEENKENLDRKSLIIPKIHELINEKDELQKSIDEIQSLLPKSKTKESLVSRIQKELKKKNDSIKHLETMQALLPSIKSPEDISRQMQTVLNECNELKGILIEMIKILPSTTNNDENDSINKSNDDDDDDDNNEDLLLNNNKENIVPQMKEIINERNNLKQQMDQLFSLLNPTTPSSSSKYNQVQPFELLKNELKNGKNAQKKISSLLSLIPDSNDPEKLVSTIQKISQDYEKMKKEIESLKSIIPSLEEIKADTLKLKNILNIENNEKGSSQNQDEIEEEEEENENEDLPQRAQLIVELNKAMKKSIEELDSLLTSSSQKSASQSPSSLKNKKPKTPKKNESIVDRLKNELGEKVKLNDQLNKLNGLMENSNSADLTDSLQNILQNNNKFKSLFKESLDLIKKEAQTKNEEEDEEEEEKQNENDEFDKFLVNLKQIMNKYDEMKNQLQSIDNLVSQQEQQDLINKSKSKPSNKQKLNSKVPTKNEKKQENLEPRLQQQFEKKKQNRENLEKIVKQLFGESFNYSDENNNNKDDENTRNIENILSNINELQNERKTVIELFEKEIEDQKNDDSFVEEEEDEDLINSDSNNKNSLPKLANKIIEIKKQNEKIISEIDSIVPNQFEERGNKSKPKSKKNQPNNKDENKDLVSRAQKLAFEYKTVQSELNKIESLLPKSDNGNDIPTQIEEILHSKDELIKQMDELRSLFPSSNSQEELKDSVSGLMKEAETLTQLKTEVCNLLSEQFPETESTEEEIPSKLRRLIKEKEELSVLLGVKEDLKSAVEILIDQKSNLKKEYDIMYDALSQLRSLLDCDSNNELVQKVTDQKMALKSSSELFIKFIETLAGPVTASPSMQLPISPQMRDKLITILSQMKAKILENDEKISQILNKAKRAGYTGIDFLEASNYLEETAVLYEQQRVNEEYHGQVSSIREIMSEQGKSYDNAKKQFKDMNKEQQAKLNELQEKFNLREAEIMAENEENKKKIITLQEDLENANKVKSELLRLASGQPPDIGFLRDKLSRDENSILQNAEKIRKIASQMEEKAKFGRK